MPPIVKQDFQAVFVGGLRIEDSSYVLENENMTDNVQ
jgi:hypothetical protein